MFAFSKTARVVFKNGRAIARAVILIYDLAAALKPVAENVKSEFNKRSA